jgi:hypothetical protein
MQEEGMSEHTATPWTIGYIGTSIYGNDRNALVCQCNTELVPGMAEANADFILRACNAYAEMLEALKAALPFIVISDRPESGKRLKLVEAVIAKAEGRS